MHEYYDKDEIKNSLTIDEVFNLVAEFGGEPIMKGESLFTAKTICHNNFGEGSHKLYYYDNTNCLNATLIVGLLLIFLN